MLIIGNVGRCLWTVITVFLKPLNGKRLKLIAEYSSIHHDPVIVLLMDDPEWAISIETISICYIISYFEGKLHCA